MGRGGGGWSFRFRGVSGSGLIVAGSDLGALGLDFGVLSFRRKGYDLIIGSSGLQACVECLNSTVSGEGFRLG